HVLRLDQVIRRQHDEHRILIELREPRRREPDRIHRVPPHRLPQDLLIRELRQRLPDRLPVLLPRADVPPLRRHEPLQPRLRRRRPPARRPAVLPGRRPPPPPPAPGRPANASSAPPPGPPGHARAPPPPAMIIAYRMGKCREEVPRCPGVEVSRGARNPS